MEIEIPPEDDINEDGSVLLKEYTVQHSGKWRCHMKDQDNWPSDFHAHNVLDGTEKMDLYSGTVFDVNTKVIRRQLKRKVMRFIFDKLANSGNAAIEAKCQQNQERFEFLPNNENGRHE